MNNKGKRIAALCILLVVGGGWAGLASRYTGRAEQVHLQAGTAGNSSLGDPNAAPVTGIDLDNTALLIRMLVSVGIVAGLGLAALYLSKKVLPRVANPAGREIRIIETTGLGPRKALHLVEVGGQRLLIASTSDRITMLSPVGEAWLDVPKQHVNDTAEL